MDSQLNKESLLMLYVADELSVEDRARVDRMLTTDASLRAELEQFRSTHAWFESHMTEADALPLTSQATVSKRIASAMRQRLADQMVAEASAPPAVRGPKYPWWAYPSAAAAIIVVGFIAYWGHQPDRRVVMPAPGTPGIIKPPSMPGDPSLAEETDELSPSPKSVASLDLAEHQLAELTKIQDLSASSLFGPSDGNE